MKILFLTDGIFPFSIGGMQKHSTNLIKNLGALGHELTVAHCVYNQDLPSQDNVNNLFNSENIKVNGFEFPKGMNFPGHYILKSYQYSQQLFRFYKNSIDNFDVIYAQGFTAWFFLKRRKQFKTKIVVNLHGLEMYQKAYSLKEQVEKMLLKIPSNYILKKADFVQSLGGKLNEILKQFRLKNPVFECGIGIEENWKLQQVKSNNEAINFIFIGRHEHRKGIDILNKVLSNKFLNSYQFKFHFVGPIPEEKQLKNEHIKYYGSISSEDELKAVFAKCDVLVLPSLSEGMPTVILEAMAQGLSVLATNVGAVSQLVGLGNGKIIHPENEHQLMDGLIYFMNMDIKELDEMKNNSTLKVVPFYWKNQVKNYENFLLKIKND